MLFFCSRSYIPLAVSILGLSLGGCAFNHRATPERSSDFLAKERIANARQTAPEFKLSSAPITQLPPPSLNVTPEVKAEMAKFGKGPKGCIAQALENRRKYSPMLEQIFEDEGVPVELLNVALIESGFRVDAKSGSGAVGIWQFMKSTAQVYGLKVNWTEDQRKDPILSTIAAARHLRDLFGQFGDWNLALAAYNAGPANIERARRKSGEADFWKLARTGKLSSQTSRFVPKFIAASLLVNQRLESELLAKNIPSSNSTKGLISESSSWPRG